MSTSPLPVRRTIVLALCAALVAGAVAPALKTGERARAVELQEYQVKAAMIYNMAKFVDWPDEAFADKSSPLVVCVVGRGAFAAALEGFRGKTVKGRPLAVRRVTPGDEIGTCHILVVDDVERHFLPSILASTRKRSVLTVGDAARFAQSGGTIGFIEQDGKMRFEINLEAAQKSHIRISSWLVKLAKVVRGE